MAAIDKLYVKDFYEYDSIRKWAIIYYPKLLVYMYDVSIGWDDFTKNYEEWVQNTIHIINREYEKLGEFLDKEEAVRNYTGYCKETFNFDIPYSQAKEEVEYIMSQYSKTTDQVCDAYTYAVMNTPSNVDRKLKWICPIPVVREYLHEQCGVNPKWEWLYRIFWRGKKYFL